MGALALVADAPALIDLLPGEPNVGVKVNTSEPKLGMVLGPGAVPALSALGLAAGSKTNVGVTVRGMLAPL
jgi:hypothetical protein